MTQPGIEPRSPGPLVKQEMGANYFDLIDRNTLYHITVCKKKATLKMQML